MNQTDLLTLVILAAVAAFLLLKLRNVLGERSGFENPEEFRRNAGQDGAEQGGENVVAMPTRGDGRDDSDEDIFLYTEPETDLGKALKAIKTADRDFDVREFMDGAKAAYEMLLTAYETGDKDTLKQFLTAEVYDAFGAAIDERKARNLSTDMRFVGIRTAEPVSASFDPETQVGEVTVRYVAEVVTAVRDANGEVIEGDPSVVRRTADTWTYSRRLNQNDPNWRLAATGE